MSRVNNNSVKVSKGRIDSQQFPSVQHWLQLPDRTFTTIIKDSGYPFTVVSEKPDQPCTLLIDVPIPVNGNTGSVVEHNFKLIYPGETFGEDAEYTHEEFDGVTPASPFEVISSPPLIVIHWSKEISKETFGDEDIHLAKPCGCSCGCAPKAEAETPATPEAGSSLKFPSQEPKAEAQLAVTCSIDPVKANAVIRKHSIKDAAVMLGALASFGAEPISLPTKQTTTVKVKPVGVKPTVGHGEVCLHKSTLEKDEDGSKVCLDCGARFEPVPPMADLPSIGFKTNTGKDLFNAALNGELGERADGRHTMTFGKGGDYTLNQDSTLDRT